MGVLPVSIEMLKRHYPARPDLTPELTRFMATITGTSCCVQLSHALNLAGERVPQTYARQRRNNSPITTRGTVYYYLLAVDEVEQYLTGRYGAGEEVSKTDSGQPRTHQQIQAYLQGRTGILAFRDTGYGKHAELWDGHQIVQRDMAEAAIFSQPRVLFWDCGPAQWLQDYMAKQV